MPQCSQPDCRVAETGVCRDGYTAGCPNWVSGAAAADGSAHAAPDAWAKSDVAAVEARRFHTGEKLTVAEASRLLNQRPARVVFCAGAVWSGKTTFLARIGEMFRDGSIAAYQFAWSSTLCAFERVSWQATIASEAVNPDTPRTVRVENDTFFHIRIHPKGQVTEQIDLLVSDLAGETFATAVALKEFCANLRALARADHLIVFLDAAQLADGQKRHAERNNVREFLSRVLAVRREPKSLQVHVVFSRWDYITRSAERDVHENFCKAIEADFNARFRELFAGIQSYRIAARPNEGEPTDKVIQALLAACTESPSRALAAVAERTFKPARDFSAFGLQ